MTRKKYSKKLVAVRELLRDKKLLLEFPELNSFNEKGFIPAGYLFEKVSLKGKRIGNAQISDNHGNLIINLGGAKASDVLAMF
jgi:UDP-N-acetylmuramate dehydrogenase